MIIDPVYKSHTPLLISFTPGLPNALHLSVLRAPHLALGDFTTLRRSRGSSIKKNRCCQLLTRNVWYWVPALSRQISPQIPKDELGPDGKFSHSELPFDPSQANPVSRPRDCLSLTAPPSPLHLFLRICFIERCQSPMGISVEFETR